MRRRRRREAGDSKYQGALRSVLHLVALSSQPKSPAQSSPRLVFCLTCMLSLACQEPSWTPSQEL